MLAGSGSCDYLATGTATRGDYGLYRWNMGPELSGPGPHFHRTISESFFVLSGTVAVFDGSRWISAHPGDVCFVPEGGRHGFRNESGEYCREGSPTPRMRVITGHPLDTRNGAAPPWRRET